MKPLTWHLTLCLPLAAALLVPLPVLAGHEVVTDGVLHIKNPRRPSAGVDTLELAELWRHGGEKDTLFFGLIVQVRSDAAGNIYALDEQRAQVFVFSPTGELRRILSRQGEGPGETREPDDLIMLPDGTLGIVQGFPGRLVRVDRQGDPAASIDFRPGPALEGNFSLLRAGRFRGGNLVLGGVDVTEPGDPTQQVRTAFLASYSLEGERTTVYHTREYRFSFDPFVFSEREHRDIELYRFDVAPDGRVYGAIDRENYRVTVFEPGGEIDRIIEREHAPLKRTPQEIQEMHELFDAAVGREYPADYEIEVEEIEPAICWLQGGIQVSDDGYLWVLPARGIRGQPAGILQTYDVFDPQGHFVRQVRVRAPGEAREDRLFLLHDGCIVQVTAFVDGVLAKLGGAAGEEDPGEARAMEIVCYRQQ